MAGLGGLERDVHRLVVADLAHQDHVGVLSQRRPESRGEVGRIEPDLSLRHARERVRVDVLDRVLDGDHVVAARLVDVIDHRSERRALAVARRAHAQHHPALVLGEGADHVG